MAASGSLRSPDPLSSADRPSRIRKLPTLVANQIAAGEVVERPASVIKELVENSIDAGATRVSVELEQGGIELIRIADDGGGITAEDLPLAVASHATSKIGVVADLDHIATLGFRGEALASIASVSRMTIRSRTRAETGAAELEVEGDRVAPVRPAAGAVGTVVTVRNLFFNTPARRKFLRTIPTEQSRCLETLRDLAMAHPAIGFQATADRRVVVDFPAGQSPRQRAAAVLGEELLPEMIEVSADTFDDARGLALWGLVGRPSVAKGNNKSQHVFVNGRPVRDKTIQHAIAESFRGLIEPGRYPTCVLMLEMSAAGVDVNVHPQKSEVRFRDSGHVHSVVLRSIRDALRAADLTPTLAAEPTGGGRFALRAEDSLPGPSLRFESRLSEMGPARDQRPDPAAFVDFIKRGGGPGSCSQPISTAAFGGGQTSQADGSDGLSGGGLDAGSFPTVRQDSRAIDGAATTLVDATPAPRLMQVHKSFLVTEDAHGVVIIDQHALHERVMFEYLHSRVFAGPGSGTTTGRLECQPLLVPIVVHGGPTWNDKLAELRPLLDRIGIAAESVGPMSLAISAFPTFLFERGVDAGEFIMALFEKAESSEFTPGTEEALRDVLDMMACKAAVKAGDRLSEGELAELVKLREAVDRSSNCPHGRPTSIRLTVRELERLFGRS